MQHANERQEAAADSLPQGLLQAAKPVVLRGYIEHWPLVQKAKSSPQEALQYLASYYNQKPVHLMQADASQNGRLFYNDDLTGFNFTRSQQNLLAVLEQMLNGTPEASQKTLYVGSTAIDSILPGVRNDNDIPALTDQALVSIWLGNQSRIAAHYDAPDNIACVVAGKRRFTLFPPEQIDNLYIGPVDFTPAGQPASLVDFHQPDFEKFPKFKHALEHAVVAELEPGDAIYIPSMWWHHVEGLSPFNILVNYWWRQVENYIGVPGDALYHAMLSIRELPQSQREAWRKFFDYYVFSPDEPEHIPVNQRGSLNPIDQDMARQLRAMLLNKLNR
ncbi:MAG: cupin-like domain-containing protein [Aestuariibacter sp.]